MKAGTKVKLKKTSMYYGHGDKNQLPPGVIGWIRENDGSEDHPWVVNWNGEGRDSNNYNTEDLLVVDFTEYLKKL